MSASFYIGGVLLENGNTIDPTGLPVSTTSEPGIVQLSDTTSSLSTTEALTANQGYNLQQQINALVASNNLTLAGTLDASTGDLATVTAEGTTAGFVVNDPLPNAAAGNSNYFVIVTVAASYSPPGGGGPYNANQGDWFLSNGTQWEFLDVGFNASYATTTSPGIITIATDLEVQTGTDATKAVTPAALQSKISDSISTVSSTTIASATAVKSAYDAAVAASLWTETAGVLSPSTANNVVTIDVPMGIDGVTVTDSALSISTLISPAQAIFLDNVQSVTVNGSSSLITHVVDSVIGTTPGILAVDEAANPVPYNLQIGELQLNGDAGTSGYVLQSNGSGSAPTWVANSPDGVAGVTGTAPITVDNTDPANPIVSVSAASTSAAGVVQLNDTVSSTSTTQAATANAVKAAYDAALSASGSSPIASATTLFVNVTTGNDSTGTRGTARPFATITAALAAASEGDTIFVAPGTYVESPTLNKGVSIIGTYVDQAIRNGPKVSGTFTVNISGPTTRNWAVFGLQFQASSTGTDSVVVSDNSFGSGGLGSFNNCFFQQFTGPSLTDLCFSTTGTWSRAVYVRNCTFDGNFTHNAGTTAGANGYLVIDNLLGIAGGDRTYRILSGTCEFRAPSNALAPVLHTGGIAVFTNVPAWISNIAASTTVFGGTGFAYKATSIALGQCIVYFSGQGCNIAEGSTWGKVSIGTNVVYAFGNVNYDTSLATLSGVPLSSAAPNPNGVLASMARPQWNYLITPSSVTAANQLGTVVDQTNGNVYSVTAFDAGTY